MIPSISTAVLTKKALELAQDAAKRIAGRTFRQGDWTLHGTIRREEAGDNLWHITVDPADPIRLTHKTGMNIASPLSKFDSDGGSIPSLVCGIAKNGPIRLDRWTFPLPYVFHDALYCAGGCFAVQNGKYGWLDLKRSDADAILTLALMCVNADGDSSATWGEVAVITESVRIFSGFAWRRHRSRGVPQEYEWTLPRNTEEAQETDDENIMERNPSDAESEPKDIVRNEDAGESGSLEPLATEDQKQSEGIGDSRPTGA